VTSRNIQLISKTTTSENFIPLVACHAEFVQLRPKNGNQRFCGSAWRSLIQLVIVTYGVTQQLAIIIFWHLAVCPT